jgi:hypothetical protein
MFDMKLEQTSKLNNSLIMQDFHNKCLYLKIKYLLKAYDRTTQTVTYNYDRYFYFGCSDMSSILIYSILSAVAIFAQHILTKQL